MELIPVDISKQKALDADLMAIQHIEFNGDLRIMSQICTIIAKMQNICNLIGWNSVHISDILFATMPISMECETQESKAGYTKHLNLY